MPEVDEYGIPIKKASTPVDEFGIPIRSKGVSVEKEVPPAEKERPMGPIPSFKEFAEQRGVVTDFGRPVTDIPAPDLALKAEQSEQIDKNRKTAIDNTITKKLTSEGLTFKKDDATWKKAEADIRKNVQDGVLAMSVNNVGEPVYKRSLNPLESYTQALNFFAKKEQDSFDFFVSDRKEKVKYAEKLELEEPEGVASEGISQVFEAAGQMTLPVMKMIGGAMMGSTLAPGAGTIAGGVSGFVSALPSTYVMGGEQNVIRLYRKAIDELKAQGQEITEDVKLSEMDKAMEQYSLGGTAQVAANVPLFRIAPAVANTFKNAVVQATKNTTFDLATQVPIAGVASVAQDVSAKQSGYNIKASEMFQNAWDMSSEAAKVIVALNVGHNMTAVPKYVASATKEFLSSMPKLDLNNMSQALEAQGVYPPGSTERLMTSLESYDKARSQVPTIIPEEYMPSMAGLMEKRANLEAQKTPENKPFHAKIDEQIAAIDKRIEIMQESPNPILDEVDDLTGDTGEATPFTEADAIKASELELGVTPEATQKEVIDIEAKKADIERRRQEAKDNPVNEPISYKEAVDEYKSTELGSSENAKTKKDNLVKEAETKEGKSFVENQVAQLEYNADGTITVYRSGTMQEGHNPATTSKKTAEIIASERKKQGLSSDIIEVRVNPSDISVVVPGMESEVFIKVDKNNKERINENTKKEQKTKDQLSLEKKEVENELEKTKKALANAKKDKAEGTFKFSDNVYNDIVKKQEAKIKNLEWQLKKYDAKTAVLEAPKKEPTIEGPVAGEPAKAEPVAPEKALAASTIRLYNLREQNALMEEIGDPVTMRQAVMLALIYGRKVGIESIRKETGLSADKRRIKGVLKSEISAKTFATEKGESIPRVAEKIWEDLPDEIKNMYDSQDAIAELIDIVSIYDDIPSLREDYIKEFYVDADKMLEDYYNNFREEVDPVQKEWEDWAKEAGERDMALELDPEYVEQLIRKEYGEEPAKVADGAPRAEEIATDKEISGLDASKEAREAAGTIRTKGDVEEVRTYDDFRKRELARPEFDAEFNKNRYEFEDKEDFIRRKFCE
jgi:hypothetical protein